MGEDFAQTVEPGGERQQHDSSSVSPDVEALSWLSVPCPSLAFHRASPRAARHVDATVQKIDNYHSAMVMALLRFSRHKWQFYINHLSDILRGGRLYLPATLCTVSVVCAGGGRGWSCWSIFSVETNRLVLLS